LFLSSIVRSNQEALSLCFFVSYLLRVHVHAHQLGHAATPHPIGTGDVYQLGRVEVSQLLQVVDGSGLQVEAPTSAELVRHEVCNPTTLMPELETPPRRLSGAATRLSSSPPRAQVEVKARVAACEQRRSSLRRP
jgi:hypothetical protein